MASGEEVAGGMLPILVLILALVAMAATATALVILRRRGVWVALGDRFITPSSGDTPEPTDEKEPGD